MKAPRRVLLEGAANFRDLGGYVAGSAVVRHGLVYRSDALHALTDGDRAQLRSLGVGVAFDLRGEQERLAEPTAAPFLRQLHVPLVTAAPSELGDTVDGEAFLADLYRRLLVEAAGVIGSILLTIAHDHSPVVIHCSAGKDRTGMVAAVLLLALGVDEQDVLDDYQLTAQFVGAGRAEALMAKLATAGLPAALAAGLLGTPRAAMAGALSEVHQRYGGVEHYLLSMAGLGRDDLVALRLRLLTT